jgi:hypothetical protein
MLFDLRGRGRRRTVQAIYVGLALLMGVGAVGFGVGGGFGGGGVLDALNNKNGSGSASFGAQIKQDKKLTREQPNNANAWASLVKDTLRQAGTGENYDSVNGGFTTKAGGLLTQAQQGWERYLKLNPHHPSADLASEMFQVLSGPGGLNQPIAGIRALQIVIASRPPSAALYANLAQLSFQAHNIRQGDLAMKKAIRLSPSSQRSLVENQLTQIKRQLTQTTSPSATTGAAGGSSSQTPTAPAGGSTGGGATSSTTTQTTPPAAPVNKKK